jgi:hypothetical protein
VAGAPQCQETIYFVFDRLLTSRGILLLLLGAALGLLVAQFLAPALGWSLSDEDGLLWGAIAGVVLAYLPGFAEAGSKLTRRDNRWLNFGVGFVATVLVLLLALAASLLLGSVMASCTGGRA